MHLTSMVIVVLEPGHRDRGRFKGDAKTIQTMRWSYESCYIGYKTLRVCKTIFLRNKQLFIGQLRYSDGHLHIYDHTRNHEISTSPGPKNTFSGFKNSTY